MHLPFSCAAFLLLVHRGLAFSFTASTPTQCDNLSVSWTGGVAPFSLLVAPIFGTPRNFDIPNPGGNKGTFQIPLQLPKDQQFLLIMSDATGFGSGGTTSILNVGASLGGSCNVTDPGVGFTFSLNSNLQQCRPYIFSDYDNATQPVTIMGVVPGGTTFVLNPPTGPTSFEWVADVASGTSMVFIMVDALGRQGGCSGIQVVSISNDKTCLTGLSPSSTIPSVSSTTRSTSAEVKPSTTESTAPQQSSNTGTTVSGGAIAGTVIGGLILLAALITLGLFFLKKKAGNWGFGDRPTPRYSHHGRLGSEVDLTRRDGFGQPRPDTYHSQYPQSISPAATSATHFMPQEQYTTTPYPFPPSQHPPSHFYSKPVSDPDGLYTPTPFIFSSTQQSQDGESELPYSSVPEERSPRQSMPASSAMSSAGRKAAMAGVSSYTPSRFIIHTDVEEIGPDENGVIELPPQYSASRAPLPLNDFTHSHQPPYGDPFSRN